MLHFCCTPFNEVKTLHPSLHQESKAWLDIQTVERIGPPPSLRIRVTTRDSSKPNAPFLTHTTHLDSLSCECCVPQVQAKLCACQGYSAPKFGVPLHSLVHKQDSLQRWQAQYSEPTVGDYKVPGTATLDRFTHDKELLMPVAAPIKPGRPSEKVIFSSPTHIPPVLEHVSTLRLRCQSLRSHS